MCKIRKYFDQKLISLIVYDFDGVITDNKVIVNENGNESVTVSRGDGTGVKMIREDLKIKQVIISTEKNQVVSKRAEKLRIDFLQGVDDKQIVLENYCTKHNISLKNVLFIGNDLNDYDAMKICGFSACPMDAESEIRDFVDLIIPVNGGCGVIRELYRLLAKTEDTNENKQNAGIISSIKKGLVYAIIPARSGSKGVKDKNIRALDGYPMIAYTIAAAKLSKSIDRIIVSTDSEKYAEIAKKYGAEVPILRPDEISRDKSSDVEFMLHIINWLYNNERVLPEFFVHLRPTNPLRDSDIIDDAVAQMKLNDSATSLRSAHSSKFTPHKWFIKNKDGYFDTVISELSLDDANNPRQDFPDIFIPDGYVDVLKTGFIIENQKIHGDKMIAFVLPDSIDIDSKDDIDKLEKIIKDSNSNAYKYLKNNHWG